MTQTPPRSHRHGRRPRHAHALRRRRSTCTRCSDAGCVDWVIEAARALGPEPLVVVTLARTRARPSTGVDRRRAGAAARNRRRRRSGPPGLEGFDGDVLVVTGDAAADHDRAAGRAARDAPRAPAPPRPCSPSSRPTRAPTAASSATATARCRRSSRRATRASEELAIREVNSSIYVFDAAKLWPALERLSPQNAQGELYLTDTVARPRRGRRARSPCTWPPTRPRPRASTRAPSSPPPRPSCATGSTSATCSPASTIVDPATTWIDPTSSWSPTARSTRSPSCAARTRVAAGAEVGPHVVAVDAEIGAGALVGPFCYLRPGTSWRRARRPARSWRSRTRGSGSARRCPTCRTSATPRSARTRTSAPAHITVNFPHQPGRPKGRTTIGRNVRTGIHNAFVAPVEIGDDAWIGGGLGDHRGRPAGVARGRAGTAGEQGRLRATKAGAGRMTERDAAGPRDRRAGAADDRAHATGSSAGRRSG